MTSCPLTRHSDASSKGSRPRATSQTAPIPYNGILAPRETHSEILTIPRRSVLWQLLPRQRVCQIRRSMEDFGCLLWEGMIYRSSYLFRATFIHDLGYLGYYGCVRRIYSAGLYLLHSRLYQHSLYHRDDCQIEHQHLFSKNEELQKLKSLQKFRYSDSNAAHSIGS